MICSSLQLNHESGFYIVSIESPSHKYTVLMTKDLEKAQVMQSIVDQVLNRHNDIMCTKWGDVVLPDEQGNCSLCGARLGGEVYEPTTIN